MLGHFPRASRFHVVTVAGPRILTGVNERPSFIVWWEDLHVGVQIAATFVVSTLLLWLVHILLLNQPTARGFMYGLFWSVPLTLIIVAGTRGERARRLRAEGREP